MYFYQPSQGHGLPHDPLNAIIGPRPIGWIASQDAEGQRNLAPYSFFNCFNYRPPIIGFASSGWKDSVRNIVETKEFVWNLATRPLAMAMNETSASIPHHEDEFVRAGLTAAASRLVSAPRVAESHIDESLLDNGIYQTARAQPILRAGGPSAYYGIDDSLRFDMIRPDAR